MVAGAGAKIKADDSRVPITNIYHADNKNKMITYRGYDWYRVYYCTVADKKDIPTSTWASRNADGPST